MSLAAPLRAFACLSLALLTRCDDVGPAVDSAPSDHVDAIESADTSELLDTMVTIEPVDTLAPADTIAPTDTLAPADTIAPTDTTPIEDDASDPVEACVDACELDTSSCGGGFERTCVSDARGCAVWGPARACPDGCTDAVACRVCDHACAPGASSCSNGSLRACTSDPDGCRTWSAPLACPTGACDGPDACGDCDHTCPAAGQARCAGGALEVCEVDGAGCRAWSAPTSCTHGFCASATACGTCPTTCELGQACADGGVTTCLADTNGCRAPGPVTPCDAGACADASTCASLVDECASGAAACPPHASCHDTATGYTCPCDCGYVRSGELCVDAWPRVLFVDKRATGTNDGSCWANAFVDLQAALAVATAGDALWVAKGTYHPATFPARTFELPIGVELYGGFAGTESQRDQRNPTLHPTILEGDLPNDPADVYHLVTIAGDATLSGFVVQNGDPRLQLQNAGGGLLVLGGAPRIEGCTFRSHHAALGGAVAVLGGAPVFVANRFSENLAQSFGACIFVAAGASIDVTGDHFAGSGANCVYVLGTARIEGATFTGSWDSRGPAVTVVDGAVEIIDSTFIDHYATQQGGALYALRSTLTVRGSTFEDNFAHHEGGVIATMGSTLVVDDSEFITNHAVDGGVVYAHSTVGAISQSRFTANWATDDGGAVHLVYGNDIALAGLSFDDNEADDYGGALYVGNDEARVVGSTFVGNTAGYAGGAVAVDEGEIVVVGSSFVDNGAQNRGAISLFGSGSSEIVQCRFLGNQATGAGAIGVNGHTLRVFDSVFSGNRSTGPTAAAAIDLIGAGLHVVASTFASHTSVGPTVRVNGVSTAVFKSVIFWSSSAAHHTVAGGVLATSSCIDPSAPFVDHDGPDGLVGTLDDRLALVPGSSCIDVGNAAHLPSDEWDLDGDGNVSEPLPLDVEGHVRVFGAGLDAGAVESF